MQAIRKVFHWYSAKNATHPYITQMCTNGPLWGTGDLISQFLTKRDDESINWQRARGSFIYGFCVAGPLYYLWYTKLDRFVVAKRRPHWAIGGNQVIASKIFLDQFAFEPVYLPFYFAANSVLENRFSVESWKRQLKDELAFTFLTDCAVWMVVQAANFKFVPVTYHSLVVNAVSIGWAGFLSFQAHKSPAPAETPKALAQPAPV